MNIETITFENNTLKIIDQTTLPERLEFVELSTLDKVYESIINLQVRGAPAIGIVAGYGFYLHVLNLYNRNELNLNKIMEDSKYLIRARPTAVNLKWAVDKMLDTLKKNIHKPEFLELLRKAAIKIHQDDKKSCENIGRFGAELISDSMNIITHCNAGILATGGIGTALAPIYVARKQAKRIHVYVDETRPVGQGARLTYWELMQNKIPATLITDNMAGALMQSKKIDMVIVGADRIVKNGDVANKIGTYGLAVLAKHHNIPFYVAAPSSTFDYSVINGYDIPIEFRRNEEITEFWNINNSLNYNVYNPAFDITPAELISAIITDKKIIKNPVGENISQNLI